MAAKLLDQKRQKKKQVSPTRSRDRTDHKEHSRNTIPLGNSDHLSNLQISRPYPGAIQRLQNEVGNHSTLRIIQRQTINPQDYISVARRNDEAQTKTSDPNIERFRQFGLIQEFTQARCMGASDAEIAAYVNEIIDSFNNIELKDQIGNGIKNRVDFLIGMTRYLGSIEGVVTHFSAIEEVTVPGYVNLHSSAATRLKLVADYLQQQQLVMPATTVALGLRNRYRPHQRNSKGRMAHPLGYAIDYRPTANPMITDPRLAELLELNEGGAINFQFKDMHSNAMNFEARRKLIQEMGKQMMSGGLKEEMKADADSFLTQFENEFTRVSQLSKTFKENVSESISTVKVLWKQQEALTAELTKLKKRKGSKSKEQVAIVQQELDAVNVKLAPFQGDMAKLFEPWLDAIAAKQRQLEQSVASVTVTFKAVDGDKNITGQQLLALNKAALDDVIKQSVRRRLKNVNLQGIRNLKREFQPIWEKYTNLNELSKALRENPAFVFEGETNVKNPAVMQLLTQGFFTPDEEATTAEPTDVNANASRHGFNLKFMQAMALFGFDQGISWSPTNLDAMHFELVEGVDSINIS